ncbi:MAG TPA: DUF309 domain-containing protein [Blastocatellia bacterium]|nr:DUF309 domain-containing protein [Blastocatellia bacterium]
MARVRIDSGPQAGEFVSLDRPKVVFGRHKSCDCVLPHPIVSRHHFFIETQGTKFVLVDNASGNGTFVNNQQVSWIELTHGDQIRAGPFVLVFDCDDEVSSDELATLADAAPAFSSELRSQYPREYVTGVDHFNSGQYYEAHEVWEEIWLRSNGEAKVFYQMLIQTSVALLHYQRGNAKGARGLHDNAVEKLSQLPDNFMSIDLVDFEEQLRKFFADAVASGWDSCPTVESPWPTIRFERTERSASER